MIILYQLISATLGIRRQDNSFICGRSKPARLIFNAPSLFNVLRAGKHIAGACKYLYNQYNCGGNNVSTQDLDL